MSEDKQVVIWGNSLTHSSTEKNHTVVVGKRVVVTTFSSLVVDLPIHEL